MDKHSTWIRVLSVSRHPALRAEYERVAVTLLSLTLNGIFFIYFEAPFSPAHLRRFSVSSFPRQSLLTFRGTLCCALTGYCRKM